ncbi:hypothetical protein, partial [Gordonia aichiensis]
PGAQVMMNIYVVVYLIVLIGVVHLVRSTPPRRRPEPIEPTVIDPPAAQELSRAIRPPRVAGGAHPDDDRPAMVD